MQNHTLSEQHLSWTNAFGRSVGHNFANRCYRISINDYSEIRKCMRIATSLTHSFHSIYLTRKPQDIQKDRCPHRKSICYYSVNSVRNMFFDVCMYVWIWVCMYVCMCVYAFVCMYVCICVCMYVCVYMRVYVCMCVCKYVCMYIRM